MSEQPRVELPPIPQEWVKSVHETPSSMAPTLKKAVPEKDIHGPLEGADTLAQPTPEESAVTVKTDATIQHESEVRASRYPTVKSPETMELQAEKAQTFKTGATMAREEAIAEAKQAAYEDKVSASKETIRSYEQDYMEYGKLHTRITDWLKKVDELLATPGALEEMKALKQKIEQAKVDVEKQLDVDQYAIAQSEPGATPFKVEVPEGWYDIEARLNEIAEEMKAPTLREEGPPTIKTEEAA